MKKPFSFILAVLLSMVGVKTSAHDFEAANSNGVTIYYKKTSSTEVAVSFRGTSYSSYDNEYSGNVVIPMSVTYEGKTYTVSSIAHDAFNRCRNLTSVTIPNSIKSIDYMAFLYCSSLTSITIPNSVTSIYSDAFAGCSSLTSIQVASGNTVYDSRNNCNAIIVSSTNTLLTGCVNTVIPTSVSSLGDDAFYGCSNLTSITIPNSVTQIGYSTFAHCTGLTSITIPNSITNIGYSAFSYCTSLTCVKVEREEPINISLGTFSNSANATLYVPSGSKAAYEAADYWKEFKEIVEMAPLSPIIEFADANVKALCVANWDINGDGELSEAEAAAVTDLGSVFKQSTTITSFNELQYFTGLTTIGSYAFSYCTNLTSIVVPSSVKNICHGAFLACNNLAVIDINTTILSSIEGVAFQGCSKLKTVNLNSIAHWLNCSLEDYYSSPFCNGAALYVANVEMTTLSIPMTATTIPARAFAGCENITSIIIPQSVNSIGTVAFSNCKGLGTINIPNNVTSIGSSAFSDCEGLTSISLSSNLSTISSYAFSGCSNLASVVIPTGITTIETCAFKGCTKLSSISIPNTVTDIGTFAFSECSSLESVTIPDNVKIISNRMFEKCYALTSVELPNSLTKIGDYAFAQCSYLSSIEIPENVEYIGTYAFLACYALKDIIIPEKINKIEYGTFSNSGLESVTIPSSITSIGSWSFNCPLLTSVTIKATNPISIDTSVFSNRTNATLHVPAGSIAAYEAADYWKEFKEIVEMAPPSPNITFADANVKALCVANWDTNSDDELSTEEAALVTNLGTVFERNTTITSFDELSYFTGLTSIGSYAFYRCNGLTSVTIPNSVTFFGGYAFSGCYGLISVTIPNSVTAIGKNAFEGCSGLTSVTIPNSVTSIGYSVFSDCSGLTSIIVESGNTVYDSRENCNAIIKTSTNELIAGCKNTVIPNSVTSIGYAAFYGCSGLTSVTIPNSVTCIGDWAFSHCSGLTSVTVENPVPVSITSYTFSNRANATLHVPAGSKAAYEAAAYWKDFKEIVEVANIGDPTANTISLADITGNVGKQVVLPIALNNQNAITGLQMDLYLPAGITVAKKSNGKMIIETTDRMDGNYTISSNTIDNYVRIAGYSGDGDAFTGTEGDILNVTLNIGENVADGDYTIRIKDIILSDVNNTEYHPADVEATLTVKSYVLGDVDNSGAVNINDVVCIINYILNKPNGTFIPEAADVDGSGSININDVVTLINRFILMKGSAPALLASALLREVSIADNYLHLADISIKPGETQEIQLLMTNANEVRGVQGNIKLPAGLSFVKKDNGKVDAKNINARSEDFTLSCAIQDNGSLTFTQYSADGFAYEGSSGGIFTFKIKADENATAGTYSVDLTGVVLSIDGVGYDIPDRTSNLTITGSDGISETLYDGGNEKWYTLDGKLLQSKPTQKGVYIVNGRVVVIK